jgi:hypothetical protein
MWKSYQAYVLSKTIARANTQHPMRDNLSIQLARRYRTAIMQAASDLFLGWTKNPSFSRFFYVRRLKNRRLGAIAELLEGKALSQYATLCGRTLARAHERSADPTVLAGYIGKSGIFDDAVASFAMLYARQNAKDYARFMQTPAFRPVGKRMRVSPSA